MLFIGAPQREFKSAMTGIVSAMADNLVTGSTAVALSRGKLGDFDQLGAATKVAE